MFSLRLHGFSDWALPQSKDIILEMWTSHSKTQLNGKVHRIEMFFLHHTKTTFVATKQPRRPHGRQIKPLLTSQNERTASERTKLVRCQRSYGLHLRHNIIWSCSLWWHVEHQCQLLFLLAKRDSGTLSAVKWCQLLQGGEQLQLGGSRPQDFRLNLFWIWDMSSFWLLFCSERRLHGATSRELPVSNTDCLTKP